MGDKRIIDLEQRVENLEFKIKMLAEQSNTSQLLFEYDITQNQYTLIMDLMDKYRKLIDTKQNIFDHDFESEIYSIRNDTMNDYHFCEYLAKAFMEDGRWEDVFPKLYGGKAKYKDYMETRHKEGKY